MRRMASPSYQPRMSKARFNKLRPQCLAVQLSADTKDIAKAVKLIGKIPGVSEARVLFSAKEIKLYPGDPNRLVRQLHVELERNHEILKHDDRKVYGYDTRQTLLKIQELSCVEQAVCLTYWYPSYTTEPPPKMRPKSSDVVLTFERYGDDSPRYRLLHTYEEGLKDWCTKWEAKKNKEEDKTVFKFWFSDQATMDLAFEVWTLSPCNYENYPDEREEDLMERSHHAYAC